MDNPIRIPGPDHSITIKPARKRVRVTWQGHVIADTTRALTLREATYPTCIMFRARMSACRC